MGVSRLANEDVILPLGSTAYSGVFFFARYRDLNLFFIIFRSAEDDTIDRENTMRSLYEVAVSLIAVFFTTPCFIPTVKIIINSIVRKLSYL